MHRLHSRLQRQQPVQPWHRVEALLVRQAVPQHRQRLQQGHRGKTLPSWLGLQQVLRSWNRAEVLPTRQQQQPRGRRALGAPKQLRQQQSLMQQQMQMQGISVYTAV